MSYTTVESETMGPLTLRVVWDESGIGNPRENTNVGVIVSWDRDGYGDETMNEPYGTSIRNVLIRDYDALAETILFIRYADYGSGGTSFRIEDDEDRANGAIFATPATIETTGCPPQFIEEGLRAEVKEYSQWANGEVYGYIVEYRGEVLDSCWGFVGDTEYPMQEARAFAADSPEYRREVVGAFAGSNGLGL